VTFKRSIHKKAIALWETRSFPFGPIYLPKEITHLNSSHLNMMLQWT